MVARRPGPSVTIPEDAMADLIDAKEAKSLLGCDDTTLNQHINQGRLRAQKVAGKLMLNKDDVIRVASGSDSDDGTIVLTGESDHLQIDLGKVVDDTSETIVRPNTGRTPAPGNKTGQLTFSDDLDVVSFEDKNTMELIFDDQPAQPKTQPVKPVAPSSKKAAVGTTPAPLSFTEANTGVLTAVDETAVGATDVNTQVTGDDIQAGAGPASVATATSASSRRSVRSNRVRIEVPQVSALWLVIMGLSLFVLMLFAIPYPFLSMVPRGDERDAAGAQARGADDGMFSSLAAGIAGFSVEPDDRRHKQLHGGDSVHTPMQGQGLEWRFKKFRGEFAGEGERIDTFIIEKIADEGKTAVSKGEKRRYPIIEGPKNGDVSEEIVDLGLAGAK